MIRMIFSVMLVLLIFAANGRASVLDRATMEFLAQDNPDSTISVIVFLSDRVNNARLNNDLKARHASLSERHNEVISSLRSKASRSQQPLLDLLSSLQAQGEVSAVRSFWIANAVNFRATADAIKRVADLKGVAEIVIDRQVENIQPIRGDGELPGIASHTNGADVIHAPEVWAMGYTGRGRLVSSIDTGVDGTHPALGSRWRGNNGHPPAECWYDPAYHSQFPIDYSQHGTHTMGTMCGRSTADAETVGIAIEAQWIAAASIDHGQTEADIIASFQFIADPDGDPGTIDDVPDVCNNSWGFSPFYHGTPLCDTTFWPVIDACENAGVVVIFAAGNEGHAGPGSIRIPADRAVTYFNSFCVGAIDGHSPDYPIANFSSLGPCSCAVGDLSIKPECVAPGVSVYSSIPGGGYDNNWSGTSMAAPHISGAVAILRQVDPQIDVDNIKYILLRSCVDLGDEGEDNTYGHGLLDIRLAVQLARRGYGSVQGNITDAGNSEPLPGRIEVAGSPFNFHADSLGHYLLSTGADTTVTLRASYFGYFPQEHDQQIVRNDTAWLDFQLVSGPRAVLQGNVTNDQGDSLPGVILMLANTPVRPETTDAVGFYSFSSIPFDLSYLVRARVAGYSEGYDSVTVYNGVNVLNFQLIPSELFEENNGGYTASALWEWGIPGPTEAHSGTHCWGTDLDGQYPDNASASLYSKFFTVTIPDAWLEFWHWYDFETGRDGGDVSISVDSGATWALLNPDFGYLYHSIYALGDRPGFSGHSNDWELSHFPLADYLNQTVQFRWRLVSDESNTGFGWYIDDVAVPGAGAVIPPDISIDPIELRLSAHPGTISSAEFNIRNSGNGYLLYELSTMVLNGRLRADFPYAGDEVSDYSISIHGTDSEPDNPPVVSGLGGPDQFGHVWIDSDEPGSLPFEWIDISDLGTIFSFGDNAFEGPFDIGFNFPFFDSVYSQLYISSNGLISFGQGNSIYLNTRIPFLGSPNNIVAIWWDDLDPGAGGTIQYYSATADSSFTVSYTGIPNKDRGGDLNFQAVLRPNGGISFNYGVMDPGTDILTASTVGIENYSGRDGLQIVYNAPYMHDSLSVRIMKSWLSTEPLQGIIAPDGMASVLVTADATGLGLGQYSGFVRILSNDPDDSLLFLPVQLNVTRGCTYLPGDINGNNRVNGLDVVYGYNYFEGGPPPPFTCDCPPHGTWFVAGDVNASCNFNGLDVSYMVSYLKGGPAPVPCDDCPPGR